MICLITSMITDWIEQHDVLLTINDNKLQFPTKVKVSFVEELLRVCNSH